jgi:hypothetical protein
VAPISSATAPAEAWASKEIGWRYDDFEASFLAFVKEVDLEPIARNDEDARRRDALERAIAALQGRRR